MLLSMQGISKAFAGVSALKSVSLEVEPAQVMALVGQNGAGKSTLIKILLGLLEPTGGHARVLGHDIEESSQEIRRLVLLGPGSGGGLCCLLLFGGVFCVLTYILEPVWKDRFQFARVLLRGFFTNMQHRRWLERRLTKLADIQKVRVIPATVGATQFRHA